MLKAFLTLEGVASKDPVMWRFDIAKYPAAPLPGVWQGYELLSF